MARTGNSQKEPLIGDNSRSSDEWQGNNILKYSSLLFFLFGAVGDQVMMKRINYIVSFPIALTQLTALTGSVLYPAIILVAFMLGCMKTSELCLPAWKPMVVAFLFVLHHILLNTGASGAAVPGLLIAVLVKTVIPFSMLFGELALGVRHSKHHWLGFVVLIVGISCTLNASVVSLPAGSEVNVVLIVLSTIPLAGAFTFLEANLRRQHREVSAVALWMWVSICMSLLSFAMLPVSTRLKHLVDKGHTISHGPQGDMLSNLQVGMSCYVRGTAEDASLSQKCAEASTFWWLSIVFALLMNIGMPLSTRYGGATLMWFVRALTIPLAAACFARPEIMGPYAQPVTTMQLVSLCIVFLGVLLFNLAEPQQRSNSRE